MSVVSRVLAFGMTLLIGTSDPRALLERSAPPLAAEMGGTLREVCDEVRRANPPVETTPPLTEPVRVVVKAGVLYLPRGFHAEGGAFDLVVHFHGSADMLGPAMEKLGIHAALYAENRGVSSSAYEWPYGDDGSLDRVFDAVKQTVVAKGIVAKPEIRRVALSAWSAGHGAVYRLLEHPAIAERVDAVLLEDALHAAFKHPATREIDDVKMAPFVRFGAEAVKGKKLLAMTHSSIPTFQFASTTETATYLSDALGAPRADVHLTRAGHMNETSSADLGAFHLLGFEGMSKEAHCDHFRGIDDTVLGFLASRWATRTN